VTSRDRNPENATIRLNGEAQPLRARSVADLLVELGCAADGGVAVAVNGEVVPRSAWSERALRPGDQVEVVGAVQGG